MSQDRGVTHPRFFARWAMARAKELAAPRRRTLEADGSVQWAVGQEQGACADHLEMSGFFLSAIISYGKDRKGRLRLLRHVTYPALRKLPNDTGGSFACNFDRAPLVLRQNGKPVEEYLTTAAIHGMLMLQCDTHCGLTVRRTLYPAMNSPALLEEIQLENTTEAPIAFTVEPAPQTYCLPEQKCAFGALEAFSAVTHGEQLNRETPYPGGAYQLAPGERFTCTCVYAGVKRGETLHVPVAQEKASREAFVASMFQTLRLESGNPVLDAQFAHCILRGSESIYQTKNGLMHGPGGGGYYAALWTNDQCEYANPFFPFSGYQSGLEQAINCYHLYEAYMDRSERPMAEKKALVTSIVAEGDGDWNGAGDRGDGAMYAYGLARFLLALGDRDQMVRFFDALVWCIAFSLSRKTREGVIASDADELENRFPSGDANLFTSCLVYDALGNGALLAEILGRPELAAAWRAERSALHGAIEQFFGGNVEGFDTYRYYKGNDRLRAWICMPLTVGIFDRAGETVRALYSPKLYADGMLKTVSGHRTTWDRSLLFALRGTLLCGASQVGTKALLDYCQNRLLGAHAPYAFEAYPEGNRAQLAAENLLFARVVTEGLFGLRVTGYHRLHILPRLTEALPTLTLRGLHLFGEQFDITAGQEGITLYWAGKAYQTAAPEAEFDFVKKQFAAV